MAERLNIAMMVGDIDDGFTRDICYGAMRAAEDNDMNLILLPGRYMHDRGIHGEEGVYEYQHNTLFSYADMDGIDAIIVTVGTICSVNNREDKDKLLKQCGNIPTVVLASREEDYPVVRYDNEKGILEAIDFLVKHRKCQHIALLSGDLHNDDARERKEAYEKGLAAQNIPYDDDLVIYGHLIANCEEQVKDLLDRHPEVQAIISANDEMAKSIYRVCDERNIKIGEDLCVVGFDDIADSCRMNPPLATVRADAATLGYEAMLLCRKPWEINDMSDVVLETRFINRESVAPIMTDMDLKLGGRLKANISEEEAESFAYDLTDYLFHSVIMNSQIREIKSTYISIVKDFIYAIFSGKEEHYSLDYYEQVLKRYSRFMGEGFGDYLDPIKVTLAWDRIFMRYVQTFDSRDERFVLFRNAKLGRVKEIIESLSTILLNNSNRAQRTLHLSNLISRDILTLAGDAEQSYALILSNLPKINIPYSVLAVWDKQVKYKKGATWKRPGVALVKAVNEYGRSRRVQRTRQQCSTRKLFSNYLFDTDERFSAVVIDLFDREEQLGLLMCKLDYDELVYDEFLTYQVSMAVKTIRIFQLQKETEKQLEETLERTRSLNIVLDNASMRDELTGLYNRRGFYRAAQEMMLLHKGEKGKYLVGYADLDYLKIINDHYGHEEGDFAIRGIAQVLKDTFGENAIIGRVGGDEYVIIEYLEDGDKTDEFRTKFEDNLKKYNKEWNKNYRISASVGLQEFTVAKDRELQIMIEEADDLLYEQKNSRTTSLNVLLGDKK